MHERLLSVILLSVLPLRLAPHPASPPCSRPTIGVYSVYLWRVDTEAQGKEGSERRRGREYGSTRSDRRYTRTRTRMRSVLQTPRSCTPAAGRDCRASRSFLPLLTRPTSTLHLPRRLCTLRTRERNTHTTHTTMCGSISLGASDLRMVRVREGSGGGRKGAGDAA